MKKVILSTSMLLETGIWKMTEIGLAEASQFAVEAENFVGHSTVRILGIEPRTDRAFCKGYDQALVLKVNGRLDFGREYSVKEIEKIGYTILLIERV